MSTRSNTAILNADGTVEMTYCHYDGYPSHRGAILLAHYTDEARVRELIALGDMSSQSTDHTPTGAHSYNFPQGGVSVFYCRDRGEDWENTKPRTVPSVAAAIDAMEEYLYLFTPGVGWSYSDHKRPLVPLTAEACSD